MAGVGLLFVRKRSTAALDRLLLGERRDAAACLRAVDSVVAGGGDVASLADALLDGIVRSLGVDHGLMLLPDSSRDALVPTRGGFRPLALRSAIAEVLRAARGPVDVDLLRRWNAVALLPTDEREWLVDADATLLAGAANRAGALQAIAVLGPKKSGMLYTGADKQFLADLFAAVAPLIEGRLAAGEVPRGAAGGSWDAPALECLSCRRIVPPAESCSCGGAIAEAAVPRVLAAKFKVLHRLGEGGMGVVYAADDAALDRRVAIKTLPRVSPEDAMRLRREARAMAAFRHPHLAAIYGIETWRGLPMLVVEYLAGGTLADRLRQGPVEIGEALNVCECLAWALAYVHKAGALHRDVKPANIGFLEDGTPKLLDFGLAAFAADRPSSASGGESQAGARSGGGGPGMLGLAATDTALRGIPLYLPPEAFDDQMPCPGWDLWALALVLYEAIAGRNPFAVAGPSQSLRRVRSAAPVDVREFAPQCPGVVAEFVAKALDRNPHRRLQTAVALAQGLADLHREAGIQASSTGSRR